MKDKVTKQKDPKRQEAARKGHVKYMQKLKEEVLKNGSIDGGTTGSDSTTASGNATNDSGSSTKAASIDDGMYTNFNHIYSVGAIAVLAFGVCIFVIPKFTTNLKNTKEAEKKEVEKKPKLRKNML